MAALVFATCLNFQFACKRLKKRTVFPHFTCFPRLKWYFYTLLNKINLAGFISYTPPHLDYPMVEANNRANNNEIIRNTHWCMKVTFHWGPADLLGQICLQHETFGSYTVFHRK